ncbi:hypothetical protein M409DRAFT_65015 [Zasmidium cellare ATCC 36951]|uniref:Amidohydrolase-related domain-containing protein n=1 Tax=Zasmidium cellare ATCC 36951 TaxID=1080233 RepID=A0A6A6CU39_ZASCE|nr:uncharacterized protein M409DRAFT_65015 [Zasmidium cellare ATCC 36951]KAF2169309.1 hypothetical protein M409DRAFT_65015 [Zasmidium cellare ATCC 36951]
MSVARIYVGRVVHSKSLKCLEILPQAALGVRGDGKISFLKDNVGDIAALRREYASEGFAGATTIYLKPHEFLFPGMIDTHLHASQWPNLALGMEGELRDWVENYTDPMEASYSDNDKARRVYSDVVSTTLRLGSTTVAYNTTIHAEASNILAQTAFDKGQRAIVGKMCITMGSTHNNWEDSVDVSLAEDEKCLEFMRNLDSERRLVHPCVQPRGGPYCPPELMAGLGEHREKYDTYVQAHMCETQSDIDRTLALHTPFTSYSAMYAAHNLLTPKTILAHCIHLQPADLSNIATTGAGVAHNPNSNTCLRDGICRVRDLLSAGIHVGLGTDCSAGYMPSIHSAMRDASNVSRNLAMQTGEDRYILAFSELVYLATLGGAEVVGMGERIGNFEVGKEFDALVVDVKEVISVEEGMWEAGSERDEDLVKKWVFLGDDRTVRRVFVGGRLVGGWGC